MTTSLPGRTCQRLIPEVGPILLRPTPGAREGRGLLLDVNVCPFPGCPERHVLVDGFLVENLDPSSVPSPSHGPLGRELEEGEADRAFVASMDVDAPGEVRVEECHDPTALRWFVGALDAELRAALLRRFEAQRAAFDAALAEAGPERSEGSRAAAPAGAAGWSATPLSPDQVVAVIAGLERNMRAGERQVPARVVRAPRIGRNDPCPCGSGKKFKRCCLGAGEDG
jgi:hypothetical protein